VDALVTLNGAFHFPATSGRWQASKIKQFHIRTTFEITDSHVSPFSGCDENNKMLKIIAVFACKAFCGICMRGSLRDEDRKNVYRSPDDILN